MANDYDYDRFHVDLSGHSHCHKSLSDSLVVSQSRVIKQRRVSYSYRTATTSYPCYIPVLGDFRGSWSYKTYPMQKYGLLSEWQAKKRDFFLVAEHEADLQGYKKEIPCGNGVGVEVIKRRQKTVTNM